MFTKMLSCFTLPLLLLLSGSSGNSAPRAQGAPEGFNPGPDIITGDIGVFGDLAQFGSSGTQVGLGVSTTCCNAGNVPVNFLRLPNTSHPLIPHNLYRMSGGSGHNDRFEQIGQSWVKHAFGADQANTCFVCQPGGDFTHLGVGCADTYASEQNAFQQDLGSRALINPFTGVFQSTANDHINHTHTGTSHRILVEASDLNTTMNPGATYYAEVQYISSDEYAWCQTHPGECNMYNNASYLRYNVIGTANFAFSPVGSVVRMSAAVNAWTDAIVNPIEPAPGTDGRAFIAYKVTGPVAGVWHYEYALYNENLDRAIQSFSLPLGCGVTVNNLGFHAPLNHPGFPNDGTLGGAGFSNAAWIPAQTVSALTWSTETFAQNQNANAIRWGTLYNFRFDSDRPPHTTSATIGFFKTGMPVTVEIQGPHACNASPTPAPSPTPPGTAQAINLSTRMRVLTDENVGIGGFIISGTAPKHVLIRAIGPSLVLSGVPDVLADPVLELHGQGGFATITTDNWRDDPAQEAAILATGIPPNNYLEAAIDATLNPGAYTAVVRGKNNTTGAGLVELYDLNPEVSAKLANISTRAFVNTGNDIVIAGFILGSHRDADRIVLRGIGPSLTALGVSNALADPTLELRDTNGALLASNNDWQDNLAQAAELTAAGLALTNQLESGIATTLPAGLYTALLAGLSNGIGVGLVEVYDLGTPSGTPSPTPSPSPTPTPPPVTPTPPPTPTPPTPTPTLSPGITPTPTPLTTATPPGNCLILPITINGAQEVPPNGSSATGTGFINIDTVTNQLFYSFTFSGLGSAETMAHIHGFAPPGVNAGIIHTLPLGSPKIGVFNYSQADEANILSGLSYVNIHSVNFPNGEIRGQIAGSATPCPSPSSPPMATPTPSPAGACVQNFDGVTAPALPPGWSGSWVTSTIDPFSPPNDAFAPNPAVTSDESLFSPFIQINSAAAQIFFKNNFNTEHDPPPAEVFYDGFVLEVSTNGGTSYNDILSVGGVFVSGPYTGEISGLGNNSLAGRMAWSGNSGGYINTQINLPASFNGQIIKLRFRMGTDMVIGAQGVRIDDFSLTGGSCP